MGTYLSTPILEKHTEDGIDLSDVETPVRWAVVDMQGWRKSMEDAHIARTDVPLPGFCKDGGGGDVAGEEFAAAAEGGDANNDDDGATKTNFTATASSSHAKVFAVFDGHGGAEVARFCQIHLVPVLTSQSHWNPEEKETAVGANNENAAPAIGRALIESFHAIDRLIDDPKSRPAIDKWRNERPPPYVAEEVVEGGSPKEGGDAKEEENVDSKEAQQRRHTIMDPNEIAGSAAAVADDDANKGEANGTGNDISNVSNMLDVDDHDEDEVFEDSLSEPAEDDDDLNNDGSEGIVNDDSDKEEYSNANEDDDGEVAEPTKKEQGTMVLSANDAVALFQKLLHINGPSNKAEDEEVDGGLQENGDAGESDNTDREEEVSEEVVIPTKAQLLNPPTGIVPPSASVPTRIQNGRKICNLPDHPVHAGCTSVVAVIVGRMLVVANAGDSRAVLCRAGGLTEPLSFDHKPLQNREMNRITHAGGFVNQFGRVNGNLNLSRSIGDMKYKQVPGIHPAEQMITAEPDILSTTLRPGDEFIVLGCDGIWDCLSNEECVKYVRDRIDTKTPTEIGMEMLDEIVSADPRASQGIGGDNMTIMIIDLLPSSRPYHSSDC